LIPVVCPKDGTLHYAEDDHVGRSLRCRKCGVMLEVKPEGQEPEQPPPTEIEQEPVESKVEPLVAVEPPTASKTNGALPQRRMSGGINILIGAVLGAIAVILYLNFWPINSPRISTQTESSGQQSGVRQTSPEQPTDLPAHAPEKRKPNDDAVKRMRDAEGNSTVALLPCAQGRSPQHLKTGERIEPDGRKSGESNIRLINRNSLDAVVRLVDNVNGRTSRFVYVQAGHSFKMEGIEAGAYSLRLQFGSDWIPECHAFTRDFSYVEYSAPLVFLDDRIRFYDVTLSPIFGRKYGTKEIDRSRFLEGE
jgi:hypothetical protein